LVFSIISLDFVHATTNEEADAHGIYLIYITNLASTYTVYKLTKQNLFAKQYTTDMYSSLYLARAIMLSSGVIGGALSVALSGSISMTRDADIYTDIHEGTSYEASSLPEGEWWENGYKQDLGDATSVSAMAVVSQDAVEPALDSTISAAPTTATDTFSILPITSAAPLPPATTNSLYSSMIVNHHNAHRANHSASPLAWDDDITATALKIANSCNYSHDV
jgi:hypothetical protein